jgi:hypothetical protein
LPYVINSWGPTTCGPYPTPKILSWQTLGTPQLWGLRAVGAPEPWGPLSLWGPQALGAPRLSLVSLVGNPPLVGDPQLGESISSIKGMKKELLQYRRLLLKLRLHSLNETKPKKTKDNNYWFVLNAPRNPLGPPTHGGPQPLGAPNR